jgi:copper chaperone CopZ
MMKTDTAEAVRYRVTGMDCSACAAKIEAAARSIAGVRDAKVSIASQEMPKGTRAWQTRKWPSRE